jgi:hypothetical protein
MLCGGWLPQPRYALVAALSRAQSVPGCHGGADLADAERAVAVNAPTIFNVDGIIGNFPWATPRVFLGATDYFTEYLRMTGQFYLAAGSRPPV